MEICVSYRDFLWMFLAIFPKETGNMVMGHVPTYVSLEQIINFLSLCLA